ncbi:MAG: 50S ribosomal protein L18e [Candidatus Methanomethylophilus sp.]|nr:50S ribosomal protein L18e [Methanomethylophilus sp.]MDD4222720.1 50S ribosomal protein L18e [Methanomethylophilus sp.]
MSNKCFKTNPQLIALISDLKAKTREDPKAAIWRDVALRLEAPNRTWAETNLSKIEEYAQDGETIVVPGKVLAAGDLTKKVNVAAYSFSAKAAAQIFAAGGKTMTIKELMAANPKGSKVRIMG